MYPSLLLFIFFFYREMMFMIFLSPSEAPCSVNFVRYIGSWRPWTQTVPLSWRQLWRHGTYGEWRTISGHVIGPTCHYDVIDYVFVAKRRHVTMTSMILCLLPSGASSLWRHWCCVGCQATPCHYDVIITSRSYHVTSSSSLLMFSNSR